MMFAKRMKPAGGSAGHSNSVLWRGLAAGVAAAVLVGTLVACGGSVTRVDPFTASRLIVFGDEYSLLDDSAQEGNAQHYSINAADSTDISGNTPLCSDGTQQLWVQSVASLYGLTFAECNPNKLDADQLKAFMRASYGAKAADVQAQVIAFEEDLQGGFLNSDIATVLVGLHDVLEIYSDDNQYPDRDSKLAEAKLRGQVAAEAANRIASKGPRVLVSLMMDAGLTPYAQEQGTNVMGLLTDMSKAFNLGMRVNLLNDGRKMALLTLDELSRSYYASTSYNHTDLACDDAHRNLDVYSAGTAEANGNLRGCTTATLSSDTASSTYLWADSLRPNARILQHQLGLMARSKAVSNPF